MIADGHAISRNNPLDSNARDAVLIDAALTCAATLGADPADAFWAGYFGRHAGAHARMAHMDEHMRGRMLASVYDLLMISDVDEQGRFLDFEIGNHDAYGAEQDMYDALFQSLGEALKGACGEQWRQAWAGAWQRRTAHLLEAIANVTRPST